MRATGCLRTNAVVLSVVKASMRGVIVFYALYILPSGHKTIDAYRHVALAQTMLANTSCQS